RRLEEPGADIGDAQSAITKRHGPEAGPPVRMLVVLSRLPQVPAIMTLLGYLHHQPELSSSRRLISQHTNNDTQALVSIRTKQNYRPIRVFGLRLLEATGRDSSIMQQYEADARVSTDPVMSMFRAFARVANMMFHASLSYSDREHFVDTVLASARDANAEMTIVSAFGRDSRSSQQGPIVGAVAPGWFESMGWGFTTEQQAQFITTLFDSAQGNVGVFIDCGIAHTSSEASPVPVPVPVPVPETETETDTGDSSNKVLKDSVLNNAQEVSFSQPADHQAALGVRPLFFADGRRVPLVIVPFFGGPDDRQALHLVADLCTHSAVQVLVWRFIKTDLPTDNDIYLDEDRFPAHPAIPQTPAEVHGKGDQPVLKLDLAATRVGDIEEGSKNEADEFYEDNVFISSMLSPCPLNASNARKRDSVASAYAATASSSSAPASPRGLVAEA
ncbi:K(+)/H(+) antiporter, partial [Coemansia asiatica]